MKDKLEVGMYVRTKKGIAKIIDRILEPDNYYFKMWVTDKYLEINDDTEYISEIDVIKASHNIIDLIEVGDYVNGYYVSKIWKSGEITHYVDEKPIRRKERQITIQAPSYGGIIHLHNKDIKSIVTKECFESIEYRLGDE
ncbi:MAG: hypothetical protein ACI31S_01960 [Bacilli bacterium]